MIGTDGLEETGSPRPDRLQAGAGSTVVTAKRGDDTILALKSGIEANGGPGKDKLEGGGGADQRDGGSGRDTLTGGDGADTFLFGPSTRRDTITDFQVGKDVIAFSDGADIRDVTIRRTAKDDIVLQLRDAADSIEATFTLEGPFDPAVVLGDFFGL